MIEAAAERVVSVISAVENYPEWTEGMRDVVVHSRDASGKPLEASFDIAGGPITDHVTLRYQWLEDNVSWHLVEGKSIKTLDGRYSWRSTGEKTEVTYELAVDLSMGLPTFLRRTAEKTIIGNALQGLKKRVESL